MASRKRPSLLEPPPVAEILRLGELIDHLALYSNPTPELMAVLRQQQRATASLLTWVEAKDALVNHAYPRLALWRRLVIYLINFLVGRYDRLDEDWNLRDHAPNEV